MSEVTPISSRKSDHIRTNLEMDVHSGLTTGLERYRFVHRALPEINLDDIDLTSNLFGKHLHAPLLISSMTGGTPDAVRINQILAEVSQATGIAIGVGSQRAAIEDPQLTETYDIRKFAPDALLFANLGAIQLNYGYGLDQCERAVEMIEADALVFHLNSLQEAVQNGGDTRFAGLLRKIEKVCKNLSVPVIIKEVGWGFSKQDVELLASVGISAIDVAGAGGTSWSQVEMYRAEDESQARLAAAFVDWGIPTSQAILNAVEISPQLPIIASGGLRNGIDIAKCIALGAIIGGLANPFLKAAAESSEATYQLVHDLAREIRVCMFGCGAINLTELRRLKLIQT